MPLEFGVWRVDERTTKLEPSHLAQEAHLEKAIENDIGLIDGNLLLIGRQVATGYGKEIDLLAINFDGDLVVIEIKRDKTPREIVAQTLDYASWILKLTYDEITEIHDAYVQQRGLPPTPFEEAFEEAFGTNPPDTLNEKHKLLIVRANSTTPPNASSRTSRTRTASLSTSPSSATSTTRSVTTSPAPG